MQIAHFKKLSPSKCNIWAILVGAHHSKRGNGAPIIGKKCIKDQIAFGPNSSRTILLEDYFLELNFTEKIFVDYSK